MTQPIPTVEAAAILGKSVSQVNRLAKDGRLQVAQQAPGSRGPRFFDPDVVREYAEERAS
ncbi:MAG TPA: helix-turn-helix domain-containing protein [Protaetiibacter sp.]|nr:helix-turn-helix domain-containing protein [Protaetiibacter sp.]